MCDPVSLTLDTRDSMLSADDVLRLQQEQYVHDRRNHSDILCLHKNDRLKHYGLHFCKYVGRLARGPDEAKSAAQTLVDTLLVSLSAANTLHQNLSQLPALREARFAAQTDILRPFADAAGRFADACEKIDHMEEFGRLARDANADVLSWALSFAGEHSIDILPEITKRRKHLAQRHFYIAD